MSPRLILALCLVMPAASLLKAVPGDEGPDKIQAVIDRMRSAIGIEPDVALSIVSENERLVSVERAEEGASFILSFEKRFLETLDEAEVEAAVAHELGHVWIFTHHPFLHTEELANRHATKAVSRESLDRVYTKAHTYRGGGAMHGRG